MSTSVTKGLIFGSALAGLWGLMVYVIPKFEQIFKDMLGKDEKLPDFTVLVLSISHMLRDNIAFAFPILLILGWFLGKKYCYLPKETCREIDICLGLGFLSIFLSIIIAMFLPLIVLMDKLGSQ